MYETKMYILLGEKTTLILKKLYIMINFIYRLEWAKSCPDTLGCVCDDLGARSPFESVDSSKNHPHQGGWTSYPEGPNGTKR